MKYGTGNIYYEKARKKYRATMYVRGKPIIKRFDEKPDAENWITEKKYESNIINVSPNNLIVGKLATYYVKSRKNDVVDTTYSNYLSMLKYLNPISKIKIQKVVPNDIENLYKNTNIPKSMRVQVHYFLNGLFKMAFINKLIRENIMLYVKKPRYIKDKRINVFSQEDITKILNYLKENDTNMYNLILLAITSGMRICELFALTKNDIISSHISVTKQVQYISYNHKCKFSIIPPKRNSKRDVIIPQEVIATLLSIKTDLLFPSIHGTYLTRNTVYAFWKKLLEKLDIPYRSFHVLRHTNATFLIANGMPLADVSKRLGHSKPTITLNVYTHALPNEDSNQSAIVENTFLKPCPDLTQ
jgi:integrase